MEKIKRNLIELIGNTPLMELNSFSALHGLYARLIVKLESFNPGGSVKDRAAISMIEAAEKDGTLRKGSVIIEPTSGNTGVGLALVGAVKKYRVILTMPETMSLERRNLLKALGAELYLTPGAEGMKGAIRRAEELKQEIPNAIIPQQFENPAYVEIHERTTAQEIWRDTDGKVDMIVAGVGTGGSISGNAKALKENKPSVLAYAVEPNTSAVLSGEAPGKHTIQGIGAGFIPKNYLGQYVDHVLRVTDDQSIKTTRELAETEGLLVGISSGAVVYAAMQLAKKEENRGKMIVVILPDTGERYLSTMLYNTEDHPL